MSTLTHEWADFKHLWLDVTPWRNILLPSKLQIYHKLKEKYVGRGGQCPTTDTYGFSDCIKWKNYGGKVYFLPRFSINFNYRKSYLWLSLIFQISKFFIWKSDLQLDQYWYRRGRGKNACNAMGGHLAVPMSQREHQNIQEFLFENLGDPWTANLTSPASSVWTGVSAVQGIFQTKIKIIIEM